MDRHFRGERDFLYTFAPEEVARSKTASGLGRDYEILRGGIKRWPVGVPIQGVLRALRRLHAK